MFSCRVGLGPCQTLAPTTEGAIIPAEPQSPSSHKRTRGRGALERVRSRALLPAGRKEGRERASEKQAHAQLGLSHVGASASVCSRAAQSEWCSSGANVRVGLLSALAPKHNRKIERERERLGGSDVLVDFLVLVYVVEFPQVTANVHRSCALPCTPLSQL